MLILILIPNVCTAAPEYAVPKDDASVETEVKYPAGREKQIIDVDGQNSGLTSVTGKIDVERINIVYDNSGHEYVKDIFRDIMIASVVAENAEIWIYPIAGNNPPIKIEPSNAFFETNYIKYSKSSNEFKAENMLEKALADLQNDTSFETKRLILYADYDTHQIKSEYDIYSGLKPYIDAYPGIIFSSYASYGEMLSSYDAVDGQKPNYDYMTEKTLSEFVLIKSGYSPTEASYDKTKNAVVLEKGIADNNIFVLATREDSKKAYISGCMMNEEGYQDYTQKSKIKGVALSYNSVSSEGFAASLFTADGTVINPMEDTLYIPVYGAENISVYQRNTKGAGVCSAETTYDCSTEKEKYYTEPEESQGIVLKDYNKDRPQVESEKSGKTEKSILGNILSSVLSVILFILRLIFTLLKILIIVLIVAMIVSKTVRSYVKLLIMKTKFGPVYEKAVIKVKKFIGDIVGSGAKVRGTADLNGDYIFISKASADMATPNSRVALVIKELESRGIKCWLSETGIKPGQDYNYILPEAIKRCKMFLLFISPVSVSSSEVISEIGTAKEYKKIIIPVQIEPFDLFGDFSNWAHMIKQYQKTDLFVSTPEEIKLLADQIEQTFNELKK